MDREVSLAVLKGKKIAKGQIIPTSDEWRRPLLVSIGVCTRYISPRQLEETALALRIRHAVLSCLNPSYIRSFSSSAYRLGASGGRGRSNSYKSPYEPAISE